MMRKTLFALLTAVYVPSTVMAWKDTCKTKFDTKANNLETYALIHNALCQEGSAVVEAIINSPSKHIANKQNQRKDSHVKSLWDLHANNVENHLDASEKFLFPKLNNAFGFGKLKSAKIVEQSHKRLRNELKEIKQSVVALGKAKDETDYEQNYKALQGKLQKYGKTLQEESQIRLNCILPPSIEKVSKEDWSGMMQEYIEAGGVNLGTFIHFMTEKKFRGEYMKAKGVPSFVWYAGFKSPFQKYQKQLNEELVALS